MGFLRVFQSVLKEIALGLARGVQLFFVSCFEGFGRGAGLAYGPR